MKNPVAVIIIKGILGLAAGMIAGTIVNVLAPDAKVDKAVEDFKTGFHAGYNDKIAEIRARKESTR